jgi:hypothetical protein
MSSLAYRLTEAEEKVIEATAKSHARFETGELMTSGQWCLDVIWELRAVRGELAAAKKKGLLDVAQAFYVSDSTLNTVHTWEALKPVERNRWLNHAKRFMEA